MPTNPGAAQPVAGTRAYYVKLARDAATAAGIPPDGFVAQIQQESGFNPRAGSPAGAQGIAQFMPATARGLGIDPMKPEQALPAAARLMRQYRDAYGTYTVALVAYNAGPTRAAAVKSSVQQFFKLPAETIAYVGKIAPAYGENPQEAIKTGHGGLIGGGAGQLGQDILGAPGDAAGAAAGAVAGITDAITGPIVGLISGYGLRLLYIVGGLVLMAGGGAVVIKSIAPAAGATVGKAAKIAAVA